mgnify:CR=1 FL=1
MKRVLFGLALSAAASPVFSQSVCDSVLSSAVFNTAETSSVFSFASSYRSAMCDKEWTSRSDIEERSANFGISYESITESLGLSSSFADNEESRSEAFRSFCAQSSEDIAYSSEFYERYRTSDVAVGAWRDCIANVEGHFAAVVPSLTLTGALVTLTKRASGQIDALDITSVESTPRGEVQCFYGGLLVEDVQFPANTREVSITCQKRADLPVTFAINSNWGTFDAIVLNGFSEEIRDLQLELARQNSQILEILGEMVSQSELAGRNYAAFGQRIRLQSGVEPGAYITRHSGGGYYINAYPLGHPNLGPYGSNVWTMVPE